MKKADLWIILCLVMTVLSVVLRTGYDAMGLVCRAAVYGVPIFIGTFCLADTGKIRYRELFAKPKSFLTLILPLFPLFLLLNLLLGNLTAAVMGLFGAEAPAVPSGNVWLLLLGSALLPAFGEELLFRAFPLVAYGNTAKRRFVFLSAAVFAAAHFSVFQIPYAFVSGILFAMIDLAAGSLLPSLIFHFANNSISIVLSVLAVSTGKDLLPPVLCVLGGLSLLSVLHIVRKRAEYRAFFTVEKDADRKQFFTISPYLYIAFGVVFAVILLFV